MAKKKIINKVRVLFKNDKPTLGTWVGINHTEVVETLSTSTRLVDV